MKELKHKDCLFCGKDIPYFDSLKVRGVYSRTLKMKVGSVNQKFCSLKCALSFRNKSDTGRSQSKNRMIGNKYGVRKLTDKERVDRSERNKGEKSHFWKGGVSDTNKILRQSIEYKLWRRDVFKRDDWTCVWCGKRGCEIQADHIKPFALFPELRFAIDNGRTLCVDCHKTTDTYAGRGNSWRGIRK